MLSAPPADALACQAWQELQELVVSGDEAATQVVAQIHGEVGAGQCDLIKARALWERLGEDPGETAEMQALMVQEHAAVARGFPDADLEPLQAPGADNRDDDAMEVRGGYSTTTPDQER